MSQSITAVIADDEPLLRFHLEKKCYPIFGLI